MITVSLALSNRHKDHILIGQSNALIAIPIFAALVHVIKQSSLVASRVLAKAITASEELLASQIGASTVSAMYEDALEELGNTQDTSFIGAIIVSQMAKVVRSSY